MTLQPPQLEIEPLPPIDAAASERSADPSIDAWLGVVSRLMRLPEATRSEIRDELREHLRERVRDLLLSGGSRIAERDAVRTAIEELGETAQLARRFEAANQPPTRRYVMHGLLTLVGAGAIAAGVMTFTNNDTASPTASTRYETNSAVVADPPKSLADAKCSLDSETSLRDAVDGIIKQANVGLMVDWDRLQENGIDHSAPLGLTFQKMPGTQALTLIAQAAGNGPSGVDWRMRDNELVEFGLRSDLDRKEVELMTYDISKSIAVISGAYAPSIEEACSQVRELLSSLVEPENWMDNGGDLAQMKLVGGRLFVQAPKRMQGKVQWILDQLPNGEPERKKENASADGAAAPQGVPILKDVPLINRYFAQLDSVSELSEAKSALEQAQNELHQIQLQYRTESNQYQRALSNATTLEERYNRLLQEHQSRLNAQSSESDDAK